MHNEVVAAVNVIGLALVVPGNATIPSSLVLSGPGFVTVNPVTYPTLCFGSWGEWLKTNATAIARAAGGRDLATETLACCGISGTFS